MANNCLFDMRITGKKKNVTELLTMMQRKGILYKYDGLGHIFSCDILDETPIEIAEDNDVIEVDVCGDCAWSISSALILCGDRNLKSETKRLNLVVEAYSSEPGNGFQEHMLIDRGEMIVDECVDYEEHDIQDYESIEEYNEENGTDFTEDMVVDEYVHVGGFGDRYMQYEYFSKEHFEEV